MTELILRFDTVESANKLLSSMLDLPDVTAVFKYHADTFRNPDKVFEKCDCCGSNTPKSTLVEVDPSVQLRIAELFEDYQIQQIHNKFEGC